MMMKLRWITLLQVMVSTMDSSSMTKMSQTVGVENEFLCLSTLERMVRHREEDLCLLCSHMLHQTTVALEL